MKTVSKPLFCTGKLSFWTGKLPFFCRKTRFDAKIEFQFRHISLVYYYVLYAKMLYAICEYDLLADVIFAQFKC
jgi:hypothetical protein